VVRGCGGALRIALMRSRYGTWVFPKGGIEPGEDLRQAARREVSEEIGVTGLREIAALEPTEHCFEREGRRYAKRVDWFLFQADPGAEARASAEQGSLDCGWFSPEQALSMLAHADQRRLLRKALSLLERWQGGSRV
jgi:diadenosine hexaphosphate hydrolase (ATP-forming)